MVGRGPSIRRGGRINPNDAHAQHAKKWHWGVPAAQKIEWKERDLPDEAMIEIGRLAELWIVPTGERRMEIAAIEASQVDKCHVAFLPRTERIYLLTTPAVRQACMPGWDPERATPLYIFAERVGGVQAERGGYPKGLLVTPLGRLAKIAYKTRKGNYDTGVDDEGSDGLSIYVHQMGEEGGIRPGIGVDAYGRLWLAGGSYVCPHEGVAY